MKIMRKLALGILGIVVLSLFAQISILASQPTYSDVMIVQVGGDNVLSEAGDIMVDSFSNRNEDYELMYKNAVNNMQIDLPSTTISSKVNLDQLARKNHLLSTNYLETTISELENGILNEYSFTILIVIGHGNPTGLIDGNNQMIWEDVNSLVNEENAYFSILASCYSNQAAIRNERVYGFSGEIDYQLAAFTSLALIYRGMGETTQYQQAFAQLFDRGMALFENPELTEALALVIGDPIGGTPPPPPPPPPTPYMSTEEYLWAAAGVVCIILTATTLLSFSGATMYEAVTSFLAVKGFLAIKNIVDGTRNYKNGVISLANWCGLLAVFLLKMFTYVIAVVAIWQGAIIMAELGIHVGTGGASLALILITVILTIVMTALVLNSIIHDWNDADGVHYPGW